MIKNDEVRLARIAGESDSSADRRERTQASIHAQALPAGPMIVAPSPHTGMIAGRR